MGSCITATRRARSSQIAREACGRSGEAGHSKLAPRRALRVESAAATEFWFLRDVRSTCQRSTWGRSSAGRAPEWHSGGHRFDPVRLHQPVQELSATARSRFFFSGAGNETQSLSPRRTMRWPVTGSRVALLSGRAFVGAFRFGRAFSAGAPVTFCTIFWISFFKCRLRVRSALLQVQYRAFHGEIALTRSR
jgi:hypothetical protein